MVGSIGLMILLLLHCVILLWEEVIPVIMSVRIM